MDLRKLRLIYILLATCIVLAAYVAITSARLSSNLGTVDNIIVTKSTHTLALYRQGKLLKTYRVSLGTGGLSPKQQSGDARTPEGTYLIVAHNPASSYHRALRVGYPTPAQTAAAQQRGIDPGGDIMVHGIRNGLGWIGPLHRLRDWTAGCIALTDPQIEEIYAAVPDGTPITIQP